VSEPRYDILDLVNGFAEGDPHRAAFYSFERAARAALEPTDPQDLSLDTCWSYIKQAFASGSQPACPVYLATGGGLTTGLCQDFGSLIIISLPPGRRRPWTALHEAAHAMHRGDGHGPAFARTTLKLWREHAGWDVGILETLAHAHGYGALL
jgi:hypothetical protein